MNYRLTTSFLGSRYNGWQKQKNGIGIQQIIEDKLQELFREKITVIGCCRTDAGVHALKHVSNFKTKIYKNTQEIKKFLNATLPRDISVLDVQEVDEKFNARFDAKGKTYLYIIYTRPNPFIFGRGWYFDKRFNLELLLKAGQIIKNADSVVSLSKKGEYIREDIDLRELSVKFDGEIIRIEVTASHFLRGMVRSMVGHMMAVARGSISLEDLERILREKNPAKNKFMAPAEGLYLKDVYY